MKGVASSGKAAYFTALFPYVVLLILLIRGVTLEGAADGILFFIRPDFKRLLDPQVFTFTKPQQIYSSLSLYWITNLSGHFNIFDNICLKVWYAAVTQCFFSLSVGFGPIIMNASYNGFRHKIYR